MTCPESRVVHINVYAMATSQFGDSGRSSRSLLAAPSNVAHTLAKGAKLKMYKQVDVRPTQARYAIVCMCSTTKSMLASIEATHTRSGNNCIVPEGKGL